MRKWCAVLEEYSKMTFLIIACTEFVNHTNKIIDRLVNIWNRIELDLSLSELIKSIITMTDIRIFKCSSKTYTTDLIIADCWNCLTAKLRKLSTIIHRQCWTSLNCNWWLVFGESFKLLQMLFVCWTTSVIGRVGTTTITTCWITLTRCSRTRSFFVWTGAFNAARRKTTINRCVTPFLALKALRYFLICLLQDFPPDNNSSTNLCEWFSKLTFTDLSK